MRLLVQLTIAVFGIALQYVIHNMVSKYGYEASQFHQKVRDVMAKTTLLGELFNYQWWIKKILESFSNLPFMFSPNIHKQKWREGVESPAVEVLRFREKYGYFASSPHVREQHPNSVMFRVGDVVKCFDEYRAVIVGWDENAKAPESWKEVQYEETSWVHEPNYAVLIDVRDRKAHKAYIPQRQLVKIENPKEIVNAEISDHFDGYKDGRYIMKPWLRSLYPAD